jgi:hypothetical protein
MRYRIRAGSAIPFLSQEYYSYALSVRDLGGITEVPMHEAASNTLRLIALCVDRKGHIDLGLEWHLPILRRCETPGVLRSMKPRGVGDLHLVPSTSRFLSDNTPNLGAIKGLLPKSISYRRPGGHGSLPTHGSHRPGRARISASGSSKLWIHCVSEC